MDLIEDWLETLSLAIPVTLTEKQQERLLAGLRQFGDTLLAKSNALLKITSDEKLKLAFAQAEMIEALIDDLAFELETSTKI